MRRPDNPPLSLNDYLTSDAPQLGLHIVSFSDATLVTLYWPHTLFDAFGKKALLDAWVLMLQGRDDEIPSPYGGDAPRVDFDPLAKFGCHSTEPYKLRSQLMSSLSLGAWAIGNLFEFVGKQETRVVRMPKLFLDKLVNDSMSELQDGPNASNATSFLSEGDVLCAWWTKIATAHLPENASTRRRTLVLNNAYSLRKALGGENGPLPLNSTDSSKMDTPYLSNAVGFINVVGTMTDVFDKSVGYMASRIRNAIKELGTAPQVEAAAALRPPANSLSVILLGLSMSPKRACDICYRRKIQCLIPEAGVPCDWCRHHDSECTFNREAPRKSKQNRLKLTDVHDLYQRIQHLESALAQATAQPLGRDDALNFVTPTSCSVETPASAVTPAATELTPSSHSARETEFSGFRQSPSSVTSVPTSDFPCFASHVGPNWFFRGIHAFSEEGRQWISSRTGQAVDLRKLRLFTSNYAPSTSFSSAFLGVSSLPDKQVMRELASSFLMSPLWPSFPVIDRSSFDQTLDIAYGMSDDRPNSPTQLAALASVLSILSLMSHCKDLGNGYSGIDANDCANKARQLLTSLTGHYSVTILECLLALYTHSTLDGHWQEAGFYLPLACSMVSALGGHTSASQNTPDDGTTLSAKKRLHLRNLFWICYVADKDMALRTGRPPLLSAVFCDVSIPKDHGQHYAYLRSFDEPVDRLILVGDGPVPHFSGDLVLSQTKEKVYRLLYSLDGSEAKDMTLLLHIRELDEEIERWRLSIPLNFRP
ncbi:fungal specific transcription factor, partial [Colletotrichum asianum]